jgi:hypothetical protein
MLNISQIFSPIVIHLIGYYHQPYTLYHHSKQHLYLRSLFVLLYFFFWSLCCLFFNIRIQNSEWLVIQMCVKALIWPLSTILLLDFRSVSTLRYFLFLHCGTFCFYIVVLFISTLWYFLFLHCGTFCFYIVVLFVSTLWYFLFLHCGTFCFPNLPSYWNDAVMQVPSTCK